MKLSVKYSLTTIIIIVVLSVFLELISIFVFSKAIHSLNKELFSERVDRLLLLAYEQDELIFEGLYSDEKNAQMRIIDKFRIIYRKNKDKVTFPLIIDTSGKVIIHPEEEKDNQLFSKEIVTFMRKQKEGDIEYSYRSIREWCVFKTFEPWNWVFCMTTSTHNRDKAIISFVWASVAISFVVIILSVLVVFFISQKYIHPIHLVIQRLEAIARGEVDLTQQNNINLETKDEIGMLSHAVSKMAEDLQKTTVSRDELVKEIIERKRMEEALRQNENYLKTIFNFVQTGVMIVDDETHLIVDVNPVIVKAFGAPKEQIVGELCHQYICPAEKGKCPITDLGQTVDNSERVLVKANGERIPVLKTVVPVILNNRKFLLESFTDITERKKAEEERSRLFEQIKVLNLGLEEKIKERTKELEKAMQVLEEANIQLQEANVHKNKFLSTMSHELRTPLNGIIGFTDLLKGQFFGSLNDKQMSYVTQVDSSSKHLLSLIDGLLTIIKVDMGKVKISSEEFNIEDSIKAVVDMLKSQLDKKNIKVNIECDPYPLEISADNDMFKQILLSLLDNSIKYTPEEGSITIRSSLNPNDVLISVTDTGIGIEPKDQEKLFSEFYQVDRVRDEALGGMGIGLSLTKRLVNLLGGKIGVESQPGKGSTFWFTLPQEVNKSKEGIKV